MRARLRNPVFKFFHRVQKRSELKQCIVVTSLSTIRCFSSFTSTRVQGKICSISDGCGTELSKNRLRLWALNLSHAFLVFPGSWKVSHQQARAGSHFDVEKETNTNRVKSQISNLFPLILFDFFKNDNIQPWAAAITKAIKPIQILPRV